MTGDLRELYQEIILEHGKRPRNLRRLERPDRTADGFNPLCGDRVTVYLDLDNGRIRDACFEGRGCAICMASASIMTEAVRGRTVESAVTLARQFRGRMTQSSPQPPSPGDDERLAAFEGVSRFPMRVKCATLPWHALTAAIDNSSAQVSTE